MANERKRQAQVSAGKLRQGHEEDLAAARETLDTAQQAVRDDPEIRLELPETQVPAGRTVLVCEGVRTAWLPGPVDLEIRGPERIGLVGANGAGKTTLLRLVAGELTPVAGTVRRNAADQIVGCLSGGERFRASLTALLCAAPASQLLLLDEPTNNLDLASVRRVEQALQAYRGGLLVASHDLPFLRSIGITRWVRLARGG